MVGSVAVGVLPVLGRELALRDFEFVFGDCSRVSSEAIGFFLNGKQESPRSAAEGIVFLGCQKMAQTRLRMNCRERARELMSLLRSWLCCSSAFATQ